MLIFQKQCEKLKLKKTIRDFLQKIEPTASNTFQNRLMYSRILFGQALKPTIK